MNTCLLRLSIFTSLIVFSGLITIPVVPVGILVVFDVAKYDAICESVLRLNELAVADFVGCCFFPKRSYKISFVFPNTYTMLVSRQ